MRVETSLKISDHLEFGFVEEIMIHFQVSTGLTVLMIDPKGEVITERVHQPICAEFHPMHGEFQRNCHVSKESISHLARGKSDETVYRQVCANGLVNVAVPVMVANEKVATLVLGEFFLVKPTEEVFRRQAHEYGYDEEVYLASLKKVPVMTEEELSCHISFLQMLTEYFAEMFQGIYGRQSIGTELSAVNQQMQSSLQQLKATEEELRHHYDLLKEKERLLKENEERWRFAIEGSQDGVWDWDLLKDKNTITEQWASMLGYTKEEVMDQVHFFLSHLHPEDRQRIRKILKQFREGEHLFRRYEFRMRCKDGTYKWILSQAKVVAWDEQGKPSRITGTHTDYTEWKEKINRLMANRQQLKFVLQGSGSGIWEWDVQEKKIFLDPGSRRILGVSKSIISTEEWNERIDPSLREEVLKDDEKIVRGEQEYEKEILMRTIDGDPFWIKVSGKPVAWDEHEKLKTFSGIIMDITEDKKRQKSRKDQKLILESFFQQSPDAIVHMTDELVIKEVNQTFLNIFEYTAEECIGKNINDLIVASHQAQEAKRIDRLAKELSIMEMETLRYTKKGKEIPVVIRGGTIRIEDEIVGYQGIYTDVSNQKKTERQLKRALTETVNSFAKLSEKRDLYIFGHQQRVAGLAKAIGKKMNVGETRLEGLWIAASLHDIGKIIIPSEILSKPAALTDLEFEFIKTHPKNAYDVLIDIDFDWPIAEIILQHHEKIDGSGYPNGLSGGEIIMEAKILMVADVVEAISSHRPQRPALGVEYALKEIQAYRGIWYDGDIVDACIRLFREDGYSLEESIKTND